MPDWKGAHPLNFSAGRAGFRPEAIVIHVMDGTLDGTDSWFNDPRSRVSAHYGVGKAGKVHQYVKETDSAYHAGVVSAPRWPLIKSGRNGSGFINPNFYTVGVEHEGRGLAAQAWPQAQLDASVALVAEIARRWSIPIDPQHIIPHCDIRHSKPDCPGYGVVLIDYIAAVQRRAPAASEAPQSTPIEVSARVLRTTNIRSAPSTQNPPLRTAIAGDRFEATALVAGELVSGNPRWLRNAAQEYIWAGNTDHPGP
jgi:N-acetylmuramoyl-L-alanine amidase